MHIEMHQVGKNSPIKLLVINPQQIFGLKNARSSISSSVSKLMKSKQDSNKIKVGNTKFIVEPHISY